MVKQSRLFSRLMFLITIGAATAWAQDTRSIVSAAANKIGTQNLRTVQYSAAGSIYDDKGQHVVVSSYDRQIDLNVNTSNVRMVLMQGTPAKPQTVTQTTSPGTPWDTQLDFWLTPYGFLKGATTSDANAETKRVDGEDYKVITVTLPGNHRIVGYINSQNWVERVESRVGTDVQIQAIYRDYADFGGLQVPTVIMQKKNGNLSQILIVKEARPNA